MATAPKIPKEQRNFDSQGSADVGDPAVIQGRDGETNVQSGQPGDADVNLDQQGRFGSLKQTLTTHWRVQER
ncbi:MAG: hypothetical protein KKA16_13440 [Alphaproteobacteria bacterium]|nr:hypothetical protein [Alphaproteobacteria bacterium]MBU2380608.1 hypothetical protein [Alphaproteobacteria bacterium]